MKTVSREQVATAERPGELPLPPRVQEALGQLVGSAKEGLLAEAGGQESGAKRRVDFLDVPITRYTLVYGAFALVPNTFPMRYSVNQGRDKR